MHDLENPRLFESMKLFTTALRTARRLAAAARTRRFQYQREGCLLEAVAIYCVAIPKMLQDLRSTEIMARGLTAFRAYLEQYIQSAEFTTLTRDVETLQAILSAIRYSIILGEGKVTVRNYDSEIDYSEVVAAAFAKFKKGVAKDYRVKIADSPSMNHIEARILDRVALLYPEAFAVLDTFYHTHQNFTDGIITTLEREIQFYLAWLEYEEKFKRTGLAFCHPRLSDVSKAISGRSSFDLALAGQLINRTTPVVCNDFELCNMERIFVVSGPNQGGKTTFARMFGQLHYLANIGCNVPGKEARLFFFDRLFTHFELEENSGSRHGKLQDDIIRMHQILQAATPNSIVIINEIFSSTSLRDGISLGQKILQHLTELDLLCVCVTFIDELSHLNEKIVSLVAAIAPENPTLRTYRLERRPADGLAYAMALAEKHRVTYSWLKKRMK
ncbi:MAG: DNA mismatch repair protein MutS [Planctomycetia bacterium]|nr:DNA mismatch repair protein MutS [Planctomycetia bacterium]